METYYLSSTESRTLDYVRKCDYVKKIFFNTGKEVVIADIDNYLQLTF